MAFKIGGTQKESVIGKVVIGGTTLNQGTIYETNLYSKQGAQVDLGATSTISVGHTDAVVGGAEAYVGRPVDGYYYQDSQDWESPVSYTKVS